MSGRSKRLSWRDDPGPPTGASFTQAFSKGRYKSRGGSSNGSQQVSAGASAYGADVFDGAPSAQGGQDAAPSLLQRSEAELLARLVGMPPQRNPEEGREGEQCTGRVARIKDRFGFLDCADFSESLFFHFSTVYPEVVEQLYQGMPVQFSLTRDRRSGRMTAVNVTPTADANVADNFMPDQQLFGMVSRKPAPWASPNDSPPGTGVIDFKYDSKLFHASYAVTDMVDNPLGMEEGDIVSFFLAINKVTLAPRAVNVTLHQAGSREAAAPAPAPLLAPAAAAVPPLGATLRGIITSVQPNKFGFIEREDAPGQMFFNSRGSWAAAGEPLPGMEVSYIVSESRGQPCASNMVPLEPGTVEIYSVDPHMPEEYGVVTEMRQQGRTTELFGVAGELELLEGADRPIAFRFVDVHSHPPIRVGDVVSFRRGLDLRDRKIYAVDVKYDHKPQRGQTKGRRETGIVAVVKEGFGFIRCAEREARVFFHFSQFPAGRPPAAGDEVSFVVTNNTALQSRERSSEAFKALDLEVLPPGTLKKDDVAKGSCVGRVVRPITDYSQRRLGSNAAERTGDGSGLLEVVATQEGDEGALPQSVIGSKVPFIAPDLHSAMTLQTGDEVAFTLAFVKGSPQPIAVGIRLANPDADKERRTVGPVCDMKDSFGFIETPNAKGNIFFHFSELQGISPADLAAGDYVSYVVVQRAGKRVAARVTKVEDEDVAEVEVLEPGLYKGQVTRPLRAPGRNYGGRVEVLEVPAIEAAETPKPTVEVKDTSGEGPSVLQEGDFPVLGNVKRSSDAPPEATQWSKSPVASAAEAAPSKKAAAPAAKGDKKGGIQVGKTLPFGIRGTLERDADPQIGDLVQFRVGANVEGQNFKAVRIKILEREPVVLATAPVETVKDKFGFISYVPEGSNEANLFFHFTNIVDDSIPAKNDIVSFEVGRNPKNAKYQAINVKMVKKYERASIRPTVLPPSSRSRATAAPLPGIIRQPSLPDGVSKGFALGRGRPVDSNAELANAVGGLSMS